MQNSDKPRARWEVHFRRRLEGPQRSLSISDARREFLGLPEEVQDEPIYITKHGRPVMTLVSVDLYEELLETLELLRDRTFAVRVGKGPDQVRSTCTAVALNEATTGLPRAKPSSSSDTAVT